MVFLYVHISMLQGEITSIQFVRLISPVQYNDSGGAVGGGGLGNGGNGNSFKRLELPHIHP